MEAQQIVKTSGDKPAVAQVLALNERLETAARTGDVKVLKDLLSRELVVSAPGNKIRRRDDVLALFDKGEVAYRSIKTTIDFVDELSDFVVIMGRESTILESAPQGGPWGPGDYTSQAIHQRISKRRRFLAAHHQESTVFAVE